MKKMLLVLSLAVAMFAASPEYKYEITPTVGGVMPEGNLDLDDQLSIGLRLGKNLNDYWFDQVELAAEYSPDVKVDYTGGEKVDIFRGSLNFLKDVYVGNSMSLYGLVGVGFEALSDNWRGNNDRAFVNYGAGLKFNFTDQLALRAEVRHAAKLNASGNNDFQNNLLYTLGLSYSFGEVAVAPAPVAAPEVVEEAVVVEEPVIGDDDGDGVLNNVDECPNTPQGVPVDEKGCAKTISLHVKFNFDQATILPEYANEISQVADFMNKYLVYKVALEGYTDSTGPDAYNLKLSDRRSDAVANELVRLGVDKNRITTAGFGETKPVATNKTREGRAENRRVEAVFSY